MVWGLALNNLNCFFVNLNPLSQFWQYYKLENNTLDTQILREEILTSISESLDPLHSQPPLLER